MNFKELQEKIIFEDVTSLKMDGVTVSADTIKRAILGQIWKTARVIKNTREQDKGGVKATIGQALQLGLVTAEEGLALLLSNSKEQIAELKNKLPKTEKTEEPTDEDVAMAFTKVADGLGQLHD